MSAQSVPTGRSAYTVAEVVEVLISSVCDLIGLGWEVDETLPWKVETLTELAQVVSTEDAARQQQ